MKKISLLAITTVLFSQIIFAGFPVGKGRFKIVPSYNFYTAKGYWDANKLYTAYTNNGKFTSNYFGIFLAAGINRNLDFVGTLPIVIQTQTETGKLSSNAGLGDISLGLSYFLSHFDDNTHLALTGSVILPGYQNTKLPYIGFQSFGTELKLGVAGSTQRYYRNPYFDIEGGARQYFSDFGPTQLFANITGGIPLSDKFKIAGTLSGVNSLSNETSFNSTNLSYNRKFSYTRLTANAGFTVNENWSIWGNIYTDISGTSIGRGSGLSIFAVIKF